MTIKEANNEINRINNEIDCYLKQKRVLEDFVESEILRLRKYDDGLQLIVYYKEQCVEKYTWQQISLRTHYSVAQCKRIYKKWKNRV